MDESDQAGLIGELYPYMSDFLKKLLFTPNPNVQPPTVRFIIFDVSNKDKIDE